MYVFFGSDVRYEQSQLHRDNNQLPQSQSNQGFTTFAVDDTRHNLVFGTNKAQVNENRHYDRHDHEGLP